MPITGPCVVAICRRQSTNWKKVTEFVLSKGQDNKTLPGYVQEGDVICLNCYNGIVTRSSAEFQQHAQNSTRRPETDETDETESTNYLSFSKAIEVITNILYIRENKENKPTLYSFDEFRAIMEGEDARLKFFFDELYSSSNPLSKNKESQARVKKQLLFVCYFLCGIRNKFVNNAKRDLAMYLDSTGASNTSIDTLANLGVTTTSRTITRHKTSASEEHAKIIDSELAKHADEAMVLNIDDYHSIHTKRMPNTTTTSTAAHLATILINPIIAQNAIPKLNIHNLKLVDAELIKLNLENKFMALYGLSHNQRWGFRMIDDNTKLEELTIHSYDIRLKEKRNARSMKDAILVDLQENNLHSLDAYIKAINTVTSVPSMQQYIQKGHIIPIVADWPGQIYLRTAISRYLCYHDSSKITDNILSFLPIIGPLHISLNSRELVFLQYRPFFLEMYKYIFGDRKPLAQKPKPWRINLLLEIARSAWQEISTTVETKFGLCKDAEYLALKDLLDNTIPLVLDVYAVFFRSGDFNAYLESCFRVWIVFLKFCRRNYTKAPLMFLSDIFYWELNNHPILEIIKAELPKFSDSTVEIFHSFLRRSTQKHTEAQQIIKYGRYINQLRLDDNGFRENFANTSTWTTYEYSARDILTLTKISACFLLQCFSEIYTRIFHHKTFLAFSLQAINSSSKRKGKSKANITVSLASMKMPDAGLSHLPLGFNTTHKPDPFRYCDSSNCSILLPTDIKILACGHTYHKYCYDNNGFKCLHCLSFIQDGVDEHVQSLLERLQRFNEAQVEEPDDDIPCDDNDENEPVGYMKFTLEEALQKFKSK